MSPAEDLDGLVEQLLELFDGDVADVDKIKTALANYTPNGKHWEKYAHWDEHTSVDSMHMHMHMPSILLHPHAFTPALFRLVFCCGSPSVHWISVHTAAPCVTVLCCTSGIHRRC